jgi:hypothetical protein
MKDEDGSEGLIALTSIFILHPSKPAALADDSHRI